MLSEALGGKTFMDVANADFGVCESHFFKAESFRKFFQFAADLLSRKTIAMKFRSISFCNNHTNEKIDWPPPTVRSGGAWGLRSSACERARRRGGRERARPQQQARGRHPSLSLSLALPNRYARSRARRARVGRGARREGECIFLWPCVEKLFIVQYIL